MKKFTTNIALRIIFYFWTIAFIIDWIRFGAHSAEYNTSLTIMSLTGVGVLIYSKLSEIEKKL